MARKMIAVAVVVACAVAVGLTLALPSGGTAADPGATAGSTVEVTPGAAATRAAAAVPEAVDPALFANGACVAFPPTAGNLHETVFLDAGHGGLDPGGTGTTEAGQTVEESAVNLAIELDVTTTLRADGYRVVDSRTGNTNVTRLTAADVDGDLLTDQGVHNDVAARDVCANLARANVLVGIYMDAGSPGEAGCLTGYDQDRPFSADNLRLARLVQGDVLSAMNAQGWQIPDAGVQSDSGLGSALTSAAQSYGHLLLLGPAKAGYFTTPSQMPGALIEPLFLTDPFEASIAASVHGQRVIAEGLVTAIQGYFG